MNKNHTQKNLEILKSVASKLQELCHEVIFVGGSVIQDVSKTSTNLMEYLSSEFSLLISNEHFLQALPGHLNYSSELEVRKRIVQDRMQKIIELGKP